jgi:mono/diheme cytochrome c family protein
MKLAPLIATVLAACASPEPLPEHLEATGLYDGDGVADDVIAFAPQYPLWTDGAEKQRWIRLPAPVDASDPDVWDFPVGTQIWKQFAFPVAAGVPPAPVETRYMIRTADGWKFGTYLWNADGTDAVLVPEGAVVDLGEGRRHDVPSTPDCLICHDNGASPVLGFSTLQLSSDLDPGALHAEPRQAGAQTLDQLVADGRIVNLAAEYLHPRIDARTPTERAARGYLHGNCGGCHDAAGPLAELDMDLRWSVHDAAGQDAPALVTTIDRGSRAALASDPSAPRVRVVPGEPDQSVLLGRMRSRHAVHQMPPLGTRVVDEEATALVARWIDELEPPVTP